jgi:NAD(P)-dependent dehydrogenase (short-subunit alcohol dehydrogenase family)
MAASPEDQQMKKIIVVTGSSSGFGRMACNALALAGHTVFASMRETTRRNAPQVADVEAFARKNKVDLRPLELDVGSEDSVEVAIAKIVADVGRLDVVIHNAGHMVYGPAESFTPEQLAELYDVNVLSTQRVNRAALPLLRQQRRGLLIWISSSSTRGGTPPYLAPYFAAKAGMDAMAVSYASELARWGVETSIIVPGSFTTGTNHFGHAGKPDDAACAEDYAKGPTANVAEVALKNLAAIAPPDADPEEVARAIVRVVDMPFGTRPFRVHIDPASDGAEVVNGVADRVRAEFLRRIGLEDTLRVHAR